MDIRDWLKSTFLHIDCFYFENCSGHDIVMEPSRTKGTDVGQSKHPKSICSKYHAEESDHIMRRKEKYSTRVGSRSPEASTPGGSVVDFTLHKEAGSSARQHSSTSESAHLHRAATRASL